MSDSALSVPAYLNTLFQETLLICSKTVEQQKVANILLKYDDVFCSRDDDMGLTDLVKHSINVEPGVAPIKQPICLFRLEKEAEVDKQIKNCTIKELLSPHMRYGVRL